MLLPAVVVCRQGAERERKLVSKRVLLGPNDELNRREATKEDYRLARLNRVMRASVGGVWGDLDGVCGIVAQRRVIGDLQRTHGSRIAQQQSEDNDCNAHEI